MRRVLKKGKIMFQTKLSKLSSCFVICAAVAAAEAQETELVDVTSPDGGIITYSESHDDYPGTKAFDNKPANDSSGRWLAVFGGSGEAFVQYQFTNGPVVVHAYRIWNQCQYDVDKRAPKSFRLEGSANGQAWTLLDERQNETEWSEAEPRLYEFENSAPFTYYRLTITASNGSVDYVGLSELELFAFSGISIAENSNATDVSATSAVLNGKLVTAGTDTTSVHLFWGDADGENVEENWSGSKTWNAPQYTGAEYSYSLSGLLPDRLYFFRFAADDGTSTTWAGESSAFITTEPGVRKVSDAEEGTLTPGVVRVSRPKSLSSADLELQYSVSGTAVDGTDFVSPSGYLVIPAGEEYADIEIKPITNPQNQESPTVVISLLPVNCIASEAASATVVINNYGYDPEYNIWIGEGNASDPLNWSQGRIPSEQDDIMLSIFSGADMTWDAGVNGLPSKVASWTQESSYTGTVTFLTVYGSGSPDDFTTMEVAGNISIDGGIWTHPANGSQKTNRLKISCGSLSLGAGAQIDVSNRGFGGQYAPAGTAPAGTAAGVHGGSKTDFSQVYGSVYLPEDIGTGASWGTNAGGGAVFIESVGAVVIDGSICADAKNKEGGEKPFGAGGSIYIKAASVSGAGTVTANSGGQYNQSSGSGGRIAIVTTAPGPIGFSTGNISAKSEWGANTAGAGTIFIKTPDQPNGSLIVDNDLPKRSYGRQPPSKFGTTCVVPGETWTFDSVEIRNNGILSVPEGSTLVLPNGFESVYASNSQRQGGILYMGGVIVVPEADSYTFSSNWVFQADEPYTIDGSVVVKDGAALGCLPYLKNPLDSYADMNLTVTGDLDIQSGAYISASLGGFDFNSYDGYSGNGGYHGGQNNSISGNVAYGSILNPVLPGMKGQKGDFAVIYGGGGAVILKVLGTLNVDGQIVSSSNASGTRQGGAGGSVNITAAYLTGSGSISANGASGSDGTWGNVGGGGGRVAVRLTGHNAAFDQFEESRITAYGHEGFSVSSTNNYASAGTIYLQDASCSENAGRVIVRGQNSDVCTTPTWFPSTSQGGESDVLTAASLEICGKSNVKAAASVKMASLEIEDGSQLDLNGFNFTVQTLSVNGTPAASGIYDAHSAPCGFDVLADSSESGEGTLTVLGSTFMLILR